MKDKERKNKKEENVMKSGFEIACSSIYFSLPKLERRWVRMEWIKKSGIEQCWNSGRGC